MDKHEFREALELQDTIEHLAARLCEAEGADAEWIEAVKKDIADAVRMRNYLTGHCYPV